MRLLEKKYLHTVFALGIAFVLTFTLPCMAQEVTVGIGFSIPPYVIKETDSGIEVDIIREALKISGHEAVFMYLPNLRLPVEFDGGAVDCVATNVNYDFEKETNRPVYSSGTTIVFQNYAVALESRKLGINSIQDLFDKDVLGFNNAFKYLGPEFAQMAEVNMDYWELADQSLQVRMLFAERVDVVVSDKRIFLYWREKLIQSVVASTLNLDQPLLFNPIFSPAPRHVVFADPKIRDDFDKGYALIKAKGIYDAIMARYGGETPQ